VLLGDEPAWPVFVKEMRAFLGDYSSSPANAGEVAREA